MHYDIRVWKAKKLHYDIREVWGYAVPGVAPKQKSIKDIRAAPKQKSIKTYGKCKNALRHTGNAQKALRHTRNTKSIKTYGKYKKALRHTECLKTLRHTGMKKCSTIYAP